MKIRIVEIPWQVESGSVVRERFEALERGNGWIRHGRAWAFDCESRLEAEGVYENGVRDGWWRHYHPDGSLDGEGAYSNDDMTGIWRYYHPNGRLAAEGACADGGADGVWTYWDADGEEEEPILWKAGYQVER